MPIGRQIIGFTFSLFRFEVRIEIAYSCQRCRSNFVCICLVYTTNSLLIVKCQSTQLRLSKIELAIQYVKSSFVSRIIRLRKKKSSKGIKNSA